MPYQHSIIIGNYNDFNFFPSILLDFKENKYFEMYFQSFIIDGYDETMKAINTKNYLMFKIYILLSLNNFNLYILSSKSINQKLSYITSK